MDRQLRRRAAALAALLMAALMPMAALASEGGQPRVFMGGGMPFVDASALTEDQQAVYEAAKADYEAIEDQQLASLVAAGTIGQADMDEYVKRRSEPRTAPEGEQRRQVRIELTDEQRQALMDAMQSGDRAQALADLVAQGVLSQEQADQMAQMDGQGMGGNLWGRIGQLVETDTAAMIAVNNIQVAAQNMRQALADAGIQMPQMGQARGDAQP